MKRGGLMLHLSSPHRQQVLRISHVSIKHREARRCWLTIPISDRTYNATSISFWYWPI